MRRAQLLQRLRRPPWVRSLWSKLASTPDCARGARGAPAGARGARGGARGVCAMASSSSSSRPAKLARLQSLRNRLPQLSQSSLSAVLKVAQDVDVLPEAISTKTIREARDAAVEQRTPYGTLHSTLKLPAIKGGELELECERPHAALWAAAARSEAFSALVAETCARSPPSVERPWRLILYADEVLPGNIMNHRGARKMWAIYWSFLNFGGAALAHEDVQARARPPCNTRQFPSYDV